MEESSNQTGTSSENSGQIPTAPNINSNNTIDNIRTISEGTDTTSASERHSSTGSSDQPPSYESLPPPYSSLF